jgi:ribosomal protein S18 acetylase RimI-like enzyme
MSYSPSLTYRPIDAGDNSFLWELYFSTQVAEVASWGWDLSQQQAFLKMQFEAREAFYRSDFSTGVYRIILADSLPIGAIFVAENHLAIELVDIALLPDYQRRGIGTSLLQELLDEATRKEKSLRLQVLKSNRALRFYEGLGMQISGETATHWRLEYRSS